MDRDQPEQAISSRMKINFLGGADEVGASSTLIEVDGKHILVDAGLRPSPKARHGLAGDQLPHLEALHTLDAILVTHAHTDHTGALELVIERFPSVPVYATPPTIALTRVLHQDARRIMQTRLDEEGELPIFDDIASQRLVSAFVPIPFKTRLVLGEGLTVTFFPAGHIAGASMIGIESKEGNILITGDISISPQRTVDGARPPAFHPDIMIVESTYGGKLHANRLVQERKLIETVASVTGQGGKVLIPAFALGRAQEILLILSEFQRRGELSSVPVWADGMVRAICLAYSSFREALPLALQEQVSAPTGPVGGPFFSAHIRPVQTNEQRNALIWQPGPAVIVASSGMLAGGPSLSYARALAGSPQHAILLTGYQDEESPGRRLQELVELGKGSIWLGKEKVDVQCLLGTYSLSAHADENQIINLVETLDPEHVVLVHGDPKARTSLEKAISERGRIVHLPAAGQTLNLSFERPSIGPTLLEFENLRSRQIELTHQRHLQMLEFSDSAGKWILLKGNPPTPVRCLSSEGDHLWVEIAPGLEQSAWPEEVLAVLGHVPPTELDLRAYQQKPAVSAAMEPNQALSGANKHFPPEARLRKTGYRLDQKILVLTFDFPDVAQVQYAELIGSLQTLTGWNVEINSEANQFALNTLVREVIPETWQVVKGPAIYRQQKRVAITVKPPQSPSNLEMSESCSLFQSISGYALDITFSSQSPTPAILPSPAGERLEINSAYAAIKATLDGSTLYRTSLKGDEIILSFISQQVGVRFQEQIADLAQLTGWRLSINPQPNQGVILEIARALIQTAGWKITKGPGIYPEKAEVIVAISEIPGLDNLTQAADSFLSQTGFRLAISLPTGTAPSPSESVNSEQPKATDSDPVAIEIPLKFIRRTRHQQTISLDPLKLEKAIERARWAGIAPPITVRRAREDYILMDGLYRLRAAQALGLPSIPAVVE